MAGTHTVASSAIVDSRPPPHPGVDTPRDHGTMAVQAGGNSARIQYVRAADGPPAHQGGDGKAGPWDKVLSFFGIRKPAPHHDRPHIADSRPADRPPVENRVETTVVQSAPPPAKPESATPFPILMLPFELLCEVMARVPHDERHFFRRDASLGTTCRKFHDAIAAVAKMPRYRDDDALARRMAGMRWASQLVPMIDTIANAKASTREWALAAVVRMAGGMSAAGRRAIVLAILQRAKDRSTLWALELMRHLAMRLPDSDGELLSILTDRAIQIDAQSDDEHLAKARVLAQLAQRISPDDLPGTVRRWESIYKAVSAHPRNEDVLTVRGLRAGFDHLSSDTFNCKFNVESEGMLLCRLIWLYRAVDSLQSRQYEAACTAEELVPREPPKPLPGTVKPPDPWRAYSSIMDRPIPKIDRLPSHIM